MQWHNAEDLATFTLFIGRLRIQLKPVLSLNKLNYIRSQAET